MVESGIHVGEMCDLQTRAGRNHGVAALVQVC